MCWRDRVAIRDLVSEMPESGGGKIGRSREKKKFHHFTALGLWARPIQNAMIHQTTPIDPVDMTCFCQHLD